MSTAPITLVIPAYNRSRLLTDTLNSALNQSVHFQEIIVVDDGSTDDTPATLATFGDSITVVRSPNQGVQIARNIGIDRAQTELVALLDSDDLLEPGYLQTMGSWMLSHPEHDAAYCNFVTFNSQTTDLDKLTRAPFDFLAGAQRDGDFAYDIPDLYQKSLSYQPLFTCGLLINKRFIRKHGAYNPTFNRVGAEDWEFTLRLISEGRVAVCTKTLARVRKHEDNDSGDHVHMSMGEAHILGYALKHHKDARKLHSQVTESIQRRLISALNSAYDAKEFERVASIRNHIEKTPPIKTTIKYLISKLPSKPREWIWKTLNK